MFGDDKELGLIGTLIEELTQLPSIGRKSAQRLTYFLLHQKSERVAALATAIIEARTKIKACETCHDYTEEVLCLICSNPRRQQNLVCVVERPEDVLSLEKFGSFTGVYHVLGGCLSPLDGIGPDELNIRSLIHRVNQAKEGELIMALNTNPDGEATLLYLKKQLQNSIWKISRLARGIPLGSDLQYVDEVTMQKALENRVDL